MAKSLLQRALENDVLETPPADPSEKTVVMKGPLSEVYAQALNIAYANKPAPSNEGTTGETAPPAVDTVAPVVATESEAIDAALMEKLAQSMNTSDEPPTDNFQTVYGVAKDAVDEDTIIQVTTDLATVAKDSNQNDYAIIIDGSVPGNNGDTGGETQRAIQLTSALESIAAANNIPVYRSLKEFAHSRKK